MTTPSLGTVLVTGGAGYIGSHVCKALALAGYRPIALDSLVGGHPWAVRWGPLEVGDLLDRAFLSRILQDYAPVAVFHLAGVSNIPETERDPERCFAVNVGGTENLLAAMRDHGPAKLVFSSSASVYGIPEHLPVQEHAPIRPMSVYGESKARAEGLMAEAAAWGLQSFSLRFFNAAGADPDGEIGEAHTPETHLIPLLLEVALGRRPSLTVFGRDYPTADGTAMRDFIHVADLAQAHVNVLSAMTGTPGLTALNLGTNRGATVLEVIEAARRITGQPITIEWADRRQGDPPALLSDSTAARQLVGWSPRWGALDDAIAHAWTWHKSQASN